MISKFLLQRAYMAGEPLGAPPSLVEEMATTCVSYVREALSLTLDYTPETLPILDHYVRTKVGDPTPELAQLLITTLGAYFGEVIRRSLPGARWYAPETEYTEFRVEFDPFFLHFNPLGVAAEVLEGEDVEGYGTHFQILDEARASIEDALVSNESVSADDYYSFTIRYETLELVTSVLIGLEESRQKLPRRFGPEVYRAASGAQKPLGELS